MQETMTMKHMTQSSRGTVRAILALLIMAAILSPASVWAKEKVNKKAASQLKLAQNLYLNGRFGEALSAVEKSLDQESKYILAHQLRGQILFSMDAMDRALSEFDEVIKLDDEYTEARNWRATTLVQLERYDEALQEYQRALEDLTYPNPEKLHLNIGMLHRLMGKLDAAVESLQRAVDLNPSYGRGYYELGVTYEGQGRYKEALRSYKDALVGMEESADLNLRLGRALLRDGEGPRAREYFEKVLKLAPNGPEAEEARAKLEQIDQTEGALNPS